jgi:hypothetical protein
MVALTMLMVLASAFFTGMSTPQPTLVFSAISLTLASRYHWSSSHLWGFLGRPDLPTRRWFCHQDD